MILVEKFGKLSRAAMLGLKKIAKNNCKIKSHSMVRRRPKKVLKFCHKHEISFSAMTTT